MIGSLWMLLLPWWLVPEHLIFKIKECAHELLVFLLSACDRATSDSLLSLRRPTSLFLITVHVSSVWAEILLLWITTSLLCAWTCRWFLGLFRALFLLDDFLPLGSCLILVSFFLVLLFNQGLVKVVQLFEHSSLKLPVHLLLFRAFIEQWCNFLIHDLKESKYISLELFTTLTSDNFSKS